MPGPRVQINDVSATPRQKNDDVHAETDEVLEFGTVWFSAVSDPGWLESRQGFRGVDAWRSRLH